MSGLRSLRMFVVIALCVVFYNCTGGNKEIPEMTIKVPLGGNTWVVNNSFKGGQLISDKGITNWSNPEDKFRVYFKLPVAGTINVGLNAVVQEGASLLKCTLNGQSKEVRIAAAEQKTAFVGTFKITEPGYHFLEIEGLSKDAGLFAEIKDVMLGGEATVGKMYFVNEEFYWGRRGPSVHLSYKVPESASDIEYFYNEVTVPEGEDVIGSYFMANGFGEGYFGFQVNSDSERRVLFSVWSPFHTNDPNSIPDDEKIILVKKGDGVTTGKFGNEGSGGQSYWKYNWIAGNTYQFLLKGKPRKDGYTEYTAWFKGPELADWKLIACFKRPKTQTWLTRSHSFLENFYPDKGANKRKAYYNNQWVRDNKGQWYEMTEAKFTADATARKESRMDYAGGVEDGKFFMQNCGFFNDNTLIDSYHKRPASDNVPQINLDRLPQ